MPRFQSPLQADTYDGIARLWRRVTDLAAKEDFVELIVQLEDLERARVDNGIRNLSDAAVALATLARQRQEKGDTPTARHLAIVALRLAPDLPQTEFTLAELQVRGNDKQWGEAISHLFQGMLKIWTHLPSRMRFVAHHLTIGLLVFVAVLLLFALSQVWRHLATLAHDVRHLMLRGVTTLQAGLLVGIALLIPLYFSLGVLCLLLFWSTIFWWYQSPKERFVAVIFVLLAVLSPFLARVTNHALSYPGSERALYHDCLRDACARPQVEWLEDEVRGAGPAPLSLYSLAVVRSRQSATAPGLRAEAIRLLERLETPKGELGYAVTNALGNAYQAEAVHGCLLRGRTNMPQVDRTYRVLAERALGAYQTAAKAGKPQPLFNQSLMLRRIERYEEADTLFRRALDMRGGLALAGGPDEAPQPAAGPCAESFNPNRALMEMKLPTSLLFSRGLGGLRLEDAHFPVLQDLLLGRINAQMLMFIAFGLLGLMLLLALVRGWVRPSWRCATCGSVGCSHCRPELADLDICEGCLFIRVKGSFVDARELWFRERRLQNTAELRRRLGRIMTFFAPGAGHLYRGWSVTGTLLLTAFAAGIGNALLSTALVPPITMLDNATAIIEPVLWGLGALIVYVVAVISIFTRR